MEFLRYNIWEAKALGGILASGHPCDQMPQRDNLEEQKKKFFALVLEGSIFYGQRIWQSTATTTMIARKQKKRMQESDRTRYILRMDSSDLFSSARLHLHFSASQ